MDSMPAPKSRRLSNSAYDFSELQICRTRETSPPAGRETYAELDGLALILGLLSGDVHYLAMSASTPIVPVKVAIPDVQHS